MTRPKPRPEAMTRWAPYMDSWALAYISGHRDMSITKRYVHSQQDALKEAIEKARSANSGHTFRHTEPKPAAEEKKELGVNTYTYAS